MKRLVFEKDKNGETIAKVVKDSNHNIGCNSLKIDASVLKQLKDRKGGCIGYESYGNRNVFNEWYTFDTMSIVKISNMRDAEEAFFVFDNGIRGKYIANLLYNHVIYTTTNKKKDSRHRAFITLPHVTHEKKDGTVESEVKHKVNVSTALWLYEAHIINSLEDNVNIVNQEAHHVQWDFDNRIRNIQLLTPEAHKEVHRTVSPKNHQIQVHITNLDEMRAFKNYLNNTNSKV